MFFLELPCFFNDPVGVASLTSSSFAFSKTSLNICKFMVHILLKPGLENFERYFASVWNERNCAVVWVFFGIAFLWDWNENWPFPVLWSLLHFPNLLTYWVQHFHKLIIHLLNFKWINNPFIKLQMWNPKALIYHLVFRVDYISQHSNKLNSF